METGDASGDGAIMDYGAPSGEELRTTDIPAHLQYKPYTVPNQFGHVNPRYLNPVEKDHRVPSSQRPFERQNFSPNRSFGGVQPRYLNARADKNPKSMPTKFAEKEIIAHEEMTKRLGHRGVAPRYLDRVNQHLAEGGGPNSPRRKAEETRAENKRKFGWKSNSLTTLNLTFDELRKRNKKYIKYDYVDARPSAKMAQPSKIKEYKQTGNVPYRPDNYESPRLRRTQSEDRGMRGWVPGGGCGGGNWSSRPNSPKREATIRENGVIAAHRYEIKDKVVSNKNVPRVAQLSAAESYKRFASAQPHLGGNSPGPRTPQTAGAQSPQRRTGSPQPQPVPRLGTPPRNQSPQRRL